MHDPITDMLTRIQNAYAVKKESVSIPHSRVKQDIAAVLKRSGFIQEFEKKGRGATRRLEIVLRYEGGAPIVSGFRRVSTPGQRAYRGYKQMFPVRSGYGIAVLSTPKGLLSDKEAKKEKVGGEIFFEMW
jgi:small subunit ribosomal protein S8